MVNAWSLAASILNGTFDEDYPIVKKEVEHSDAYYDYKRNDPDAENPFTDPKDRARADFVVGGGNTAVDKDLEWIESLVDMNGHQGSPWTLHLFQKMMDLIMKSIIMTMNYMTLIWTMMYSHHFGQNTVPPHITTEFKYNENEILKIAEEYIAKTYTLHYTGKKGTQTLDLIESIGDAEIL